MHDAPAVQALQRTARYQPPRSCSGAVQEGQGEAQTSDPLRVSHMEAPCVLSRSTEIRMVTLCWFRAGWECARVGDLDTYGARAHLGHMAAMYFTDRVRMIKIQLYNPILPELTTTTSSHPSSSHGANEATDAIAHECARRNLSSITSHTVIGHIPELEDNVARAYSASAPVPPCRVLLRSTKPASSVPEPESRSRIAYDSSPLLEPAEARPEGPLAPCSPGPPCPLSPIPIPIPIPSPPSPPPSPPAWRSFSELQSPSSSPSRTPPRAPRSRP